MNQVGQELLLMIRNTLEHAADAVIAVQAFTVTRSTTCFQLAAAEYSIVTRAHKQPS